MRDPHVILGWLVVIGAVMMVLLVGTALAQAWGIA